MSPSGRSFALVFSPRAANTIPLELQGNIPTIKTSKHKYSTLLLIYNNADMPSKTHCNNQLLYKDYATVLNILTTTGLLMVTFVQLQVS